MSRRPRQDRAITFIEVLVVIVIICIIAALLAPRVGNCRARAGTASHLISQLDQAAEAYQLDYGVYPTCNGTGSHDLVEALSPPGPNKKSYFMFPSDLLTSTGDVVNPVWADGDPTLAKIYYRLNAQQENSKPPALGRAQPPIQRKSKFDMWCAGCDWTTSDPRTQWSINNF